jgi:hypothetical protein
LKGVAITDPHALPDGINRHFSYLPGVTATGRFWQNNPQGCRLCRLRLAPQVRLEGVHYYSSRTALEHLSPTRSHMPSNPKRKSFWTRTSEGEEIQVFIYDPESEPETPQMLT